MFDPRIRLTSHRTDLAILIILWVQLTLGLITLPLSLSHSDGSVMLVLADWAQRVFTFRVGGAEGLIAIAWPYKVHIVLGMTIFLLFPFSRLVHVWSGFATLAYFVPPVPGGAQPPPEPAGRPQPAARPCLAHRSTASRCTPRAKPLSPEELRQRACTELLRQAAQAAGLLAASDAPSADGVISEAAAGAIEALLEASLKVPEPSDEACRRHHAAHEASYRTGERVRVRHILFAVTPGVDVVALRKRAEPVFLDVRCHDGQGARSRPFRRRGAQVVQLPQRRAGRRPGLAQSARIARRSSRASCSAASRWACCRAWCTAASACISSRCWSASPASRSRSNRCAARSPWRCASNPIVTALRQYLRLLAGQASVEGVELDAADTPLVQ